MRFLCITSVTLFRYCILGLFFPSVVTPDLGAVSGTYPQRLASLWLCKGNHAEETMRNANCLRAKKPHLRVRLCLKELWRDSYQPDRCEMRNWLLRLKYRSQRCFGFILSVVWESDTYWLSILLLLTWRRKAATTTDQLNCLWLYTCSCLEWHYLLISTTVQKVLLSRRLTCLEWVTTQPVAQFFFAIFPM